MFLKNKRCFKKRGPVNNYFYPSKSCFLTLLLKFRLFTIKPLLKKLIKLSKIKKIKVFLSLKKNMIISKKSKNSRMGKGKGSNVSNFCLNKNKLFRVTNISSTRFSKIKKKISFFLKNKTITMLNFSIKISFFLINSAVVILFVLIGGVIPLIERKFLSLTHRRVGPKYVGYKGRFQFIADALKLLLKEFIIPKNVNKFFFYITPIFLLNINLIFVLNVVFFKNICVLESEYNLLYLLLVESLNNVIFFLIGFFIKNKYTQISSVRVLNLLFVLEISVSLFLTFVYFLFKNFSFSNLSAIQGGYFNIFNFTLVIPFLTMMFLIFLKKTPFDVIEAETEIIMGFHAEHCGFLAGSLILIEYVHLFF